QAQPVVLTVGLDDSHVVPFVMLASAKRTVAAIYAEIGVKVVWRSNAQAQISMQFDAGVPDNVHPGAAGYALPYGTGGTRIHILYDRVVGSRPERLAGVLLGHSMAHE